MNTKIMALQFALFFKSIIERPDIVFADINKKMLNIFDAIPASIPIPPQLPSDIPIISHRSESNEYLCNISRSRLDLICQRINAEKTNSEIFSDFNAKIDGLVKYVFEKQPVIRFGMIARYFLANEDPVHCIKEKYFSANLDNVSELSVRFNQISEFDGYIINDIVEISAAEAIIEGAKSKGVFVQRDINNQPDLNRSIDYKTLFNLSEKYAPRLSEKLVEELIK